MLVCFPTIVTTRKCPSILTSKRKNKLFLIASEYTCYCINRRIREIDNSIDSITVRRSWIIAKTSFISLSIAYDKVATSSVIVLDVYRTQLTRYANWSRSSRAHDDRSAETIAPSTYIIVPRARGEAHAYVIVTSRAF